jgi:hypothetical protein
MHIDSTWTEVFAACERIGTMSATKSWHRAPFDGVRQGTRLTVNDFGGFKNTLLKFLRSSQDVQENT